MLKGVPWFYCAVSIAFCILAGVSRSRAQDNDAELRQHFEAARQAQTNGDFNTAIREYQTVIHLQPAIAEVYANLGLVYQNAARFDESAQTLQKAIELKPDLRGVNLFLGIDFVKLNQATRALQFLRKAAQQEPGNKEAVSWLGTALWDAGQTTAALKQLRKVAQAFPTDCDVLFLLGEAYQKAANQDLEQVLGLTIGKPLYHQIYGDIYRDQRVWDKAEGHYRKALEESSRWQGAHLGLGEVYLNQHKWPEAEVEFKQEKEAGPAFAAAALAKLSELALLQGQVQEAIRNLTAAIQLSPEKASDALGLPPLPLSSESDPNASPAQAKFQEFLSAQDRIPDCPARHLALAYVNARLGSSDQSISEWKLFVGGIPDSRPVDKMQRANLLFARHDYEAASEELQTVVSADPRDLNSLYLRGKTYRYLSVFVLAQMLNIDPNFYRGHELLARTYQQREENDKALAEYKIVEQLRPQLSGLHFAIGHLLWTMQDSDAALGQLKEELRSNPGHPEANAEIGTILVNKHQADEAIPYLKKALALKPDLFTARQQLGMAFYQRNDLPGAERELKRAISDDPEGSAHFLLGMVYRKMGRAQESNAALAESRRIRSERLAGIKIEKDERMP